MIRFFKGFAPFIFLFSGYIGYAQIEITGKVLSATDPLPITGASVYFDGTSIGVSSDDDGTIDNNISIMLIINALGFNTRFIEDSRENKDLRIIFLEETIKTLGEVHLDGKMGSSGVALMLPMNYNL